MMIVPLILLPTVMLGTTAGSQRFMVWYPVLLSAVGTVLCLGKDIVFSWWGRQKLYSKLRERAWPASGSRPPVLPPVAPMPSELPATTAAP
jgi:hypothetical protein